MNVDLVFKSLQIIMEPGPSQHQDKSYIKSKKKWRDFELNEDLIDALIEDQKDRPTRVQSETLELALNPDRKKFNLLLRAANGAGKTMAFLIPIMNSIRPGLPISEDKTFRGRVQPNEVFKPQGIIIVQTNILQDQIQRILKSYAEIGQVKNSEKLKFKVGRMDKEAHQPGDIIVTMPKSFLNRHQRGNLKLDQCKFVAIDEVDDTYEHEKDNLADILKILEASPSNVITCSATMKKEFLEYYQQHSKDFIKCNINQMVQNETKQRITLEGVKHYFHKINTKDEMYKFIITKLYKYFYQKVDKKPQMFVFFDSIEQINKFHEFFKARASDLMSSESQFLEKLTIGIIAANHYKDGKKQPMTITEKNEIMRKFRNQQTTILLATNIIARGIDVRKACFVINVGPPKQSEKDSDFDLDVYLHRVGRTGRHNDRGIALTLLGDKDVDRLVTGINKIHKIQMKEMKDPEALANEVRECMKFNSE